MADQPDEAKLLGVNRGATAVTRPAPAHSPGLYRAALFDAGAMLARLFPLSFLRLLAGGAGSLYARIHPRRVAQVAENLSRIDRRLSCAAARQVYAEFGKTLADYFFIGTRPPGDAMKIIARIDGVEHLHAAHAMGSGVLVVTAHLGLFELGGLLLTQHGFSATVLTYPEPSRALTEWRADFRRRWGVETLEIGTDQFAFLQIAQQLRQGKFVATLIDRPHPTDSTPVQLPNGTAFFSAAGIILLAQSSGAPIVTATMVRLEDGAYHAQVFPPIRVESQGTRSETLRHYSQKIADTLAPVLAAHPTQWYQFVPVDRTIR